MSNFYSFYLICYNYELEMFILISENKIWWQNYLIMNWMWHKQSHFCDFCPVTFYPIWSKVIITTFCLTDFVTFCPVTCLSVYVEGEGGSVQILGLPSVSADLDSYKYKHNRRTQFSPDHRRESLVYRFRSVGIHPLSLLLYMWFFFILIF